MTDDETDTTADHGDSTGEQYDAIELQYDVPPDATAYKCTRCGRPLASEERLALHRGVEHPEDLDPDERAAFRDADDERRAIRRFRLQALGVLVVLYFGLLMIYALV